MDCIEQAFLCHYRPLCLYAMHYVADVNAVEDIVQDCFVKLIEQEDGGQHIRDRRAWLYRIVRNQAVDHLRKEKKTAGTILPKDLDTVISDDEAQERSEREARLWTAIDSLPQRCREVFLMAKRDNMTYREIALQLGISEKTVEHQISKALRTLRGKASEFYYILFFVA